MYYVKFLLILPIIAACAFIGILSGLLEHAVSFIGSGSYRLQCRVIDWAETSRRRENGKK